MMMHISTNGTVFTNSTAPLGRAPFGVVARSVVTRSFGAFHTAAA